MVSMIKRFSTPSVAIVLWCTAVFSLAAEAAQRGALPDASDPPSKLRLESPKLEQAKGMITLDYQVIRVPSDTDIDLLGFHVFNKLNDWIYLGVGGFAPLFKGEYGGFMAFDVSAHVQRRIHGPFFADAGIALGGGGGGKNVEQSRVLSGTGGFVRSYVGLGYEFKGFSVGAHLGRMKFKDSAINSSQLNLFVQVPFSYNIGDYASAGERFFATESPAVRGVDAGGSESILTFGLDNMKQIRPGGLYKGAINLVELQFSHFITQDSYWYFNAGAGYHGRPLYNQAFGGLGYRFRVTPRASLYSQLGLGSGGYAPETIDTGPGLLVFPKMSAEYLINKSLGATVSAGYLFAPRGSSKNYTFGASLNYHIRAGQGGAGAVDSAAGELFSGYRLSLFQQTESAVKSRGANQPNINLLTTQIDNIVNSRFYIPVQVSVAYNAYLTYPGYGEILAGVGIQNRYERGDRFQFFGQLLAGANVHGAIFKTGIGMNYSLSDRWALYGVAGQTSAGLGSNKERFKADYIGAGLTYRFSVPSR